MVEMMRAFRRYFGDFLNGNDHQESLWQRISSELDPPGVHICDWEYGHIFIDHYASSALGSDLELCHMESLL